MRFVLHGMVHHLDPDIVIRNQTGDVQTPLGLCGRIEIDVDAYDTPPVEVPDSHLDLAPLFRRPQRPLPDRLVRGTVHVNQIVARPRRSGRLDGKTRSRRRPGKDFVAKTRNGRKREIRTIG